MENVDNNEPLEIAKILVDAAELTQLTALLQEYREDLGVLVSVLHSITGLFSGKKSAISMVPTIMKLINDPKQLERFQHIVPIIEKYTKTPVDEQNG